MKTPDTKAGRLTELVMARVRGKLPEMPTHEYNRVYECVLSELNCHVIGETHEIPKLECSICKGNGFIDVEKYDHVEQEDCRWCGTTGIEPQPPMPDSKDAEYLKTLLESAGSSKAFFINAGYTKPESDKPSAPAEPSNDGLEPSAGVKDQAKF